MNWLDRWLDREFETLSIFSPQWTDRSDALHGVLSLLFMASFPPHLFGSIVRYLSLGSEIAVLIILFAILSFGIVLYYVCCVSLWIAIIRLLTRGLHLEYSHARPYFMTFYALYLGYLVCLSESLDWGGKSGLF